MKANICLLFPVTDDDVIAWAAEQEKERPIVDELAKITHAVRKYGIECSYYYDSDNFNDFARRIKALDSPKCYLSKNVEQIKFLLFRKLRDINHWVPTDRNISYIEWHSATCTTNGNVPSLYKYAIESFGEEECAVINFNLLNTNNDNEIHILKDSHLGRQNLPAICSLSLMESIDDTLAWLYSLNNGNFSLRNIYSFAPTTYMWGNSRQRIYRRIDETLQNTLWYYDFFHKDNHEHYEVFNEAGDHVGEADTDGHLIPNSKDPRKSISHILHGR